MLTQKGYSQNNDLESQADEVSLTPRSQSGPPQNGAPSAEKEDDDQEDMEGLMTATEEFCLDEVKRMSK